MSLKVPKYRENESSFELEEMIHPLKTRKDPPPFHTREKTDYALLKREHEKGKVKK